MFRLTSQQNRATYIGTPFCFFRLSPALPVDSAVDYQSLFRSLPDSYLLLAADGTILDNTDEHVAVSLLPRAQAVGRDIFVAYPSAPESQRQLRESHDYVRAHRQPHTMELLRYDLERPAEAGGGTKELYWEVTHYPVLDANGELQYILQRPQNVTARIHAERERQATEAALAEQHAMSEFVLDALPLIIWTTLADGTTTYLNRGWFEFTGQDPAINTATLDTTSLIHPDDLPAIMVAQKRGLETNSSYQFEYRLRRHDGEFRWLLGRAAPRRDEATGEITLWAGAATDIHQQRTLVRELETAAEEQLTLIEQAYQASRAVQHQRDTFYDLFRQAPAIIAVLRTPEHRFEFVNTLYQQLFPHRQLLGLTVAEAIPEVVEQGIVVLLDNVYRTGETFYGNELEMSLERDNTRELRPTYFNFIYKRFDDESGRPAGIMCFAFEVTELVYARQRLESSVNPDAPAA